MTRQDAQNKTLRLSEVIFPIGQIGQLPGETPNSCLSNRRTCSLPGPTRFDLLSSSRQVKKKEIGAMLPKSRAFTGFLLLLLFKFFFLYTLYNGSNLSTSYRASWRGTMSVTHTVLFQFKSDLPDSEVREVGRPHPTSRPHAHAHAHAHAHFPASKACGRFLALQESCIHPTSNAQYILSLKGGRDNSPEGLQVCPGAIYG